VGEHSTSTKLDRGKTEVEGVAVAEVAVAEAVMVAVDATDSVSSNLMLAMEG